MSIKFGADIYAPEEVNELARASIGYIESDVMDIKKRYVTLGFHLYEMDQCRYYEDLGYENLYECIEANFAMDKSAVSRCIGVWKAFAAVDGDGSRKMWVDDRYKDFSYSQLTEMLPMSERDRYRISSDMSVKKIREVKNTPIIMVSAKKDDIDKIRGLGLGADDYMTKPFSPSELVARVKAHMDRYNRLIGSTTQKNDIIEIRGIKIDKTARRVWVNGEEKAFTTKEFDLLVFLAQNPNHVFTKEELFKEIWDMESVGDIATVTVHIKKIREKIEMDTAKPQYIETIWGVGYRFKL